MLRRRLEPPCRPSSQTAWIVGNRTERKHRAGCAEITRCGRPATVTIQGAFHLGQEQCGRESNAFG